MTGFGGFPPETTRLHAAARQQPQELARGPPGRLRGILAGARQGVRAGRRRAARAARAGDPRRAQGARLDLPHQPRHPVRQGSPSLQGPHRLLVLGGRPPPRRVRQFARITPEIVGVGCHGFDPARLRRFRRAVADRPALRRVGGRRLPAGWGRAQAAAPGVPERWPGRAAPAPQGTVVHRDEPADDRVNTGEILDVCARHWRALARRSRGTAHRSRCQPRSPRGRRRLRGDARSRGA